MVRPADHVHDSPEAVARARARMHALLEGVVGADADQLSVPARRVRAPAAAADLRRQPPAHLRRPRSSPPRRSSTPLLHGLCARGRKTLMLLRLLRTHLAPYKPWLAVIVVLQFVATVAMLYLPSLNADIIDNGVAVGDTDYILRVGAVMLGGLAGADRLLGGRGRVLRADRDVVRPRPARRGLPPGRLVLGPRGRAVRRTVADHPQHQRRPAGADARPDDLLAGRPGADHDGRRHRDGDARGPRPLLAARGRGAGAVPLGRARGHADGAELPAGAVPHRRRQPDPARADQRHPGGPRVRPRATGAAALRRGQRRPHRGLGPRRPLDGDDVPAGDAGREHLQRRGDLVRRPPGRQRPDAGRCADRVPQLPDADPDERDDGDVHADADPALRGLRGPDRRGARHRAQRRTPARGRHRADPARPARPRGRVVHLPGRRAAGALRRQLQRPARPDRRDHRLDRRRQVHAGQPGPAALRRDDRRRCGWTASTSATSTPSCSGRGSGWCRRRRSCSAAPSAATCCTASRTRPRTSSGTRSRWPRAATSSSGCPRGSTRRSSRAAPTSPAGSGSGSRSPGRWSAGRRSTSSTTRSPRSTWPPTPGCAPRCGPRPATRPSSWSPSGSPRSATPT